MDDLNETLHKLKYEYLKYCHNNEDLAWNEAYQELAHEGKLIHLYKYGYRCGRYSYMYLYGKSALTGVDYTYLAARLKGSQNILISEYNYFEHKVIRRLIKDCSLCQEIKTSMLAGLGDLYGHIVKDYITRFILKASSCADDKVKELSIPDRHAVYNSIRNGFIEKLPIMFDILGIKDIDHTSSETDTHFFHKFLCNGISLEYTLYKNSCSDYIR